MLEKPLTKSLLPEEHRTRVGLERRRRTREQLLRAVFEVVDQQGMDRFGVERVRLKAGLSRGSFYSHFGNADELLAQLSHLIWEQVQEEQAAVWHEISSDPLGHLCSYLSYGVTRGTSDGACGRVLLRSLPLIGSFGDAVRIYLFHKVSAAVELCEVNVPSIPTAVDLVLAVISEMLRSAIIHGPDAVRVRDQIKLILQALGVSRDRVVGLTAEARPAPRATSLSLRSKVLNSTWD